MDVRGEKRTREYILRQGKRGKEVLDRRNYEPRTTTRLERGVEQLNKQMDISMGKHSSNNAF